MGGSAPHAAKNAVLAGAVGGSDIGLYPVHPIGVFAGSADEPEWRLLESHLEGQEYLELTAGTWPQAARIYFDLWRSGKTVGSPIDCCIAQLALEHDVELLHYDRDFDVIATVRNLRQRRLHF